MDKLSLKDTLGACDLGAHTLWDELTDTQRKSIFLLFMVHGHLLSSVCCVLVSVWQCLLKRFLIALPDMPPFDFNLF